MRSLLNVADVPVIFLSAYGRDEVVARAFEMGAADYVTKPFSPTELVARVRAALRRGSTFRPSLPTEPYVAGDLTVNYVERRVTMAADSVSLTDTEYRLLVELSANAGAVLTHEELLERVWGSRNSGDIRLVRGVIKRLRGKLGDSASDPKYIHTELGAGYRMTRAAEARTQNRRSARRHSLANRHATLAPSLKRLAFQPRERTRARLISGLGVFGHPGQRLFRLLRLHRRPGVPARLDHWLVLRTHSHRRRDVR